MLHILINILTQIQDSTHNMNHAWISHFLYDIFVNFVQTIVAQKVTKDVRLQLKNFWEVFWQHVMVRVKPSLELFFESKCELVFYISWLFTNTQKGFFKLLIFGEKIHAWFPENPHAAIYLVEQK